MPARVQIQIEAQDAASGVLRAITSQFGSLGQAASDLFDIFSTSAGATDLYNKALTDTSISVEQVAEAEEMASAATARFAETVARLAIDFLKSAVEETQKYAQEIRDLSAISGMGAEATARFIQVLDDYQLTAQDAETATRMLTKNGYAPTVETLAQLSDQYLTITDAQERNDFILKNLGRSGFQWVNMLQQGGAAIRALSADVNENLILSEEQLAQQERQRLALDALADAWQGVKIQTGAAIGEMVLHTSAVNEANKRYQEQYGAVTNVTMGTKEYQEILAQVKAEQQAQVPVLDSATRSYIAMGEAMGRVNVEAEAYTPPDYGSLINDITNAQQEVDRYNQTNKDLRDTQAELFEQRQDLVKQLQTLLTAEGDNADEIENVRGDITNIDEALSQNSQELNANANAHKRWAAQTVFAFAQARAAADGNITKGEGEALIAMGVGLDLFDQKTADVMSAVNESFDSLDTENPQDQIDDLLRKLHALTDNTWTIDVGIDTGAQTPGTPPPGVGDDDYDGTQQGGEVYANNQYMVGERGMEPFIPSVNGRVLGHAESLHALSLGLGGGGSNYFYGNVTLQISEETGQGLMSYR